MVKIYTSYNLNGEINFFPLIQNYYEIYKQLQENKNVNLQYIKINQEGKC